MTVVAAAGLVLLFVSGAPGCSTPEQAPGFALPAPAAPDIVSLAAQNPADALKTLEARRATSPSIEAEVLRARLLGTVGRHAESA